jgi:hypothetical protein
MRILFSSVVVATILVAASAVGWKAEAATMTGVGTLPLQTQSYTPVETVGYARRHYRRAHTMVSRIGPMVITAIDRMVTMAMAGDPASAFMSDLAGVGVGAIKRRRGSPRTVRSLFR